MDLINRKVRFIKKEYMVKIISQNTYKSWLLKYPEFQHIKYGEWSSMFKLIIEEIKKTVLESPSGFELPMFLGRIIIGILDIDATCEQDFLISRQGDTYDRVLQIGSAKKAKIIWKKHPTIRGITKMFGAKPNRAFQRDIANYLANNTDKYKKAGSHTTIPTKCEEIPEKSMFD
jgi:hypothetical protein